MSNANTDRFHILMVHEDHISAMTCFLAIGILSAMRDGITSTEAGIWTLAMPRFWKPLEDKNLLDKDVLKIIKHIDEIDALHELVGGEKWKEVTEKYINALYDVAEQKGWDNLALTWKIADGSISQPKQPLD